ncbi:melanin-concentrating hormone receptor 2 isoform X2 [Cygnus atratus]|nr:melanin-concentrating hormone receptor 2 isoform X2 [Cygnus atratus]
MVQMCLPYAAHTLLQEGPVSTMLYKTDRYGLNFFFSSWSKNKKNYITCKKGTVDKQVLEWKASLPGDQCCRDNHPSLSDWNYLFNRLSWKYPHCVHNNKNSEENYPRYLHLQSGYSRFGSYHRHALPHSPMGMWRRVGVWQPSLYHHYLPGHMQPVYMQCRYDCNEFGQTVILAFMIIPCTFGDG